MGFMARFFQFISCRPLALLLAGFVALCYTLAPCCQAFAGQAKTHACCKPATHTQLQAQPCCTTAPTPSGSLIKVSFHADSPDCEPHPAKAPLWIAETHAIPLTTTAMLAQCHQTNRQHRRTDWFCVLLT